MNHQDQEPVQLTTKHLEALFIAALVTIVGFLITKYLIVPDITFTQYFFMELVISSLIIIGSKMLGRK